MPVTSFKFFKCFDSRSKTNTGSSTICYDTDCKIFTDSHMYRRVGQYINQAERTYGMLFIVYGDLKTGDIFLLFNLHFQNILRNKIPPQITFTRNLIC